MQDSLSVQRLPVIASVDYVGLNGWVPAEIVPRKTANVPCPATLYLASVARYATFEGEPPRKTTVSLTPDDHSLNSAEHPLKSS